jgi:hypothetical protein
MVIYLKGRTKALLLVSLCTALSQSYEFLYPLSKDTVRLSLSLVYMRIAAILLMYLTVGLLLAVEPREFNCR